MHRLSLFLFFILTGLIAISQTGSVIGKVASREGEPLKGVNIVVSNGIVISTDSNGRYEVQLDAGQYTLTFSYVGYRTKSTSINVNQGALINLDMKLKVDPRTLEEVEVVGDLEEDYINPPTRIDSRTAEVLPSAFGDFSKILVTLPGVASNNEFSTAYSVRGGNFDENLVYVNDIPVYRPFLSTPGRQEGLSFVNPSMVSNIRFSAGGWEPKYGDRLSSSLNILYQEPDTLTGELVLGLLGGSATFGQKINDRLRVVTGIRHRDSRYLLGATEIEGQYFPTYSDVQSLFTFDLSNRESNRINRTKLHWLVYYGRNRYLTEPASQTTQFGSIQANFRIQTAFEGRELLNYDVYQSGINLSHIWSEKWLSRIIASGVYTIEREYFDVEGAYRICDVDNDPNSGLNDCIVVRGVGTNYNYGRNWLSAGVYNLEFRNEHLIDKHNFLEWGLGMAGSKINDQLREYSFTDSADFVNLQRSVFNELDLVAKNYSGYLQHTYYSNDSINAFIGGVRFNYWDFNQQLIVSPRLTYRIQPRWKNPTVFTFSTGYYQQFPFYRELRTNDGTIRQNTKAQRSIHFIAGAERQLMMWGRSFYFNTEMYYKRLQNMIPFDIENVRLRYLEQNNAFGYAAGIDFRINGEFIPGTQSWFSLGILQTQENIAGDEKGFIRRPTDQRINMAIYFEDHMPNDPTLRVYLNLVYGSGYPTGPPGDLQARNIFSGDAYYRADIGVSKEFGKIGYFRKSWLRLELLNALGADNTLSYSWIEDFGGNQFAIPNSLSARFLNVKFIAEL